MFFSCGEKENRNGEEEAHWLFTESAETILQFTQMVSTANDSLKIDSLNNLLEKKLVDLNFNVPPNTDLKMSEQENDSLYRIMAEYRKLKAERYEALSVIHNDSIKEEDSFTETKKDVLSNL